MILRWRNRRLGMRLEGDVLLLEKELSELDRRVLSFVEVLERQGVDYVIVSGYWAILTGRSRGTEDIDVLIEELGKDEALGLAEALEEKGYWCINAGKYEVYGYLSDGLAVRFAEEGEIIPNFEVKFVRDSFDDVSLQNPVLARIKGGELRMGPLELQVAYKLFLGSEKDFEDALHLYTVFGGNIDVDALEMYVEELRVEEGYSELKGA